MGKRSRENATLVADTDVLNALTIVKKRKLKESEEDKGEQHNSKKNGKESENRSVPDGKAAIVPGIDDAKAARKERKRMKAEKKAKTKADGTNTSNGHSTSQEPSLTLAEDKKSRKLDRKRSKGRGTATDNTETNGKGEDDLANGDDDKQDNNSNVHRHTSTGSYSEDQNLTSLPQRDIDDYLSKHFITITDPKSTKPLRPITSFSFLPKTAIQGPSPFTKFTSPTPIQSATWPFILAGRDIIGVAETGSGKTLAFGVPLIQHITLTRSKGDARYPARAVIVSPTRELAVQIYEQIEILAKLAGFKAVCIYGGVPKEPQKQGLKSASVIIATPGRLNDLLQEGSANISKVDYLVLDEADRMLDKGFEEEIKKIISGTQPMENRQTLMFTATWPQTVRTLAGTFMKDPVKIMIGDHASGELRANTRIEQRVEVLDTHPRTKETRLLELLKQLQPPRKKSADSQANRVLVFALYKKEAARIEQFLQQRGHNVAGIHGDLSQDRRTAALNGFRAGTTPLLVATDVAARGLDIPAVKAVINLTFPLTVEDYVHRIGRTGRAGSNGLAITFFTEYDKALAGGLANVLRAANQVVPEELLKFGGTVKKKQHDAYGAFYKEPVGEKKATKVKFDD